MMHGQKNIKYQYIFHSLNKSHEKRLFQKFESLWPTEIIVHLDHV